MKTLIIYASFHHKNTKKIAEEIASVLNCEMIEAGKADNEEIKKADLIGFGSGVYFSKFHKSMINLARNLPETGAKAFLFSTSGVKKNILLNRSHNHFKKILKRKNFEIVGEFNCLGLDTNSVLKLFGGINKGRPNEEDLEKAKIFAKDIKNRFNASS